ncbi:cytochrome d ubiquinol oxidase subunit II [Georgenia ruanii]|uniref:Cytochrome d ubiquinol oxidase subunit II n=1 Tax=Georgenia ruanii TaxID=348442 RepID=A0A7J9UVZ4_9MICO|nr:cytochrome d ubiquinol oxidase subunit II [Georgenia ruanii]MPV88786.1 cytochrome d ubiquinol oxidase subunit II [Georgenia ruanii]
MSSADVVAVVLLLLIAAYGCGGGADFGAGIWDLLAGDRYRGARPRELVDYAMAPVWEANNVWLVFALIVTWTGFPPVFEAVMSTMWVALILAALGLVLRGAAFAIRKPTLGVARRHRLGVVFGVASVLTPYFLASAFGGVASGRVPPGNRQGDPITSWLNPTSVVFGLVGLAAAAFVAASFLVSDARRFGEPDLEAYFRRRSIGSGGVLLLLMVVGLLVMHQDAARLFDGLTSGWGLVFGILAAIAVLLTGLLLSRGVLRATRLTAVAAVALLVLAWGAAQRPYALPTTLTIDQAAGDPDTLRWLVVVTVVAVVLVGPALALLFRLDTTARLAADHDEDLTEVPPAVQQ